ncbi:MAG TPA: type II secretion system protein [Burkholderiaceae bacterium]
MKHRQATGFTLIELLVTLALVGLLALVSLPLFEVTSTRMKEEQLREALRTIRGGLDAYKRAVDTGLLPREAGASGYPPSLEVLTEPLDMANKVGAGFGSSDTPQRLVILRQLPRDPFFPDPAVPAAQTWRTRAYGSRSDDPQPGDDVYDVSSMSTRVGLDGIAYGAW